MFKKSFVVFVIGLLVNLLLGQFSPSYSQYLSQSYNFKSKTLSLSKLNKPAVLFDSTYKYQPLKLEPVEFGDVFGELASGYVGGNFGAVGIGIITAAFTGLKINFVDGGGTSGFGLISFLVLLSSVQVLGSAAGVWAAGTNKKVGADFGTTLLGSLGGFLAEVGGFFLISSINEKNGNGIQTIAVFVNLALPTVGAIIGLNSTRYPKRTYESIKSVINLNESNITLSSPSVYLEQDKTLHRKPITFLKMVSINF